MVDCVRYFIGIDGGKSGGISIIDEYQKLLKSVPIPLISAAKGETYDILEIEKILDEFPNKLVILEQSHPMFRDGVKRAFVIGELYGIMKTILILKKIPFEIVSAKSWQKKVFQGMIIRENAKPSIEYCRNRFPEFDFVQSISGRGQKVRDGLTDSVCMAIYGAMK